MWHLEPYLERLVVFLLLLVDYSQSEVNLMGLVEIRLHLHDLREGLLRMVQRAVTVIEYANAVPKSRLLMNVNITNESCRMRKWNKLTFGFRRLTKQDW